MGFVADSRYTAKTFALRAAARLEAVPTQTHYRHIGGGQTEPYEYDPQTFRVFGECGHVLAAITARDEALWQTKIDQGKPHRRRCEQCPK